MSWSLTAGAVDFTIRIGLPQLELATLATGATAAIPTSGSAVTRAADAWSVTDDGWLSSGAGRATIDGTTLAGTPFSTTQVGDGGHLNPVASLIAATPNGRITRLRYWRS